MSLNINTLSDIHNNFLFVNQQNILNEIMQEIRDPLEQLKANNPKVTESEQRKVINEKVPPTLKQRCLNAFKAGGWELLDNAPYGKVLKAAIKGWNEPLNQD
ncbi:MAG: hypothetical protein F6K19_36985 [Cyanothece sp. SIO1E1]|nr:hypothetical protein [Cyanothece sp. SIO1E1]